MPVSRFLNCDATIDHIPSYLGRPGVCSQSVDTIPGIVMTVISPSRKCKSGAFTKPTVTSFPNQKIHHS